MSFTTIGSPLTAQNVVRTLPEATTFSNSTGQVARYYFRNNPWKLSDANSWQKVYRFCVICGSERFSDEKWSKVIDIWGPPTICEKDSCWKALERLPNFVPRKHYIIETELDFSRVKFAKEQEFFEDI